MATNKTLSNASAGTFLLPAVFENVSGAELAEIDSAAHRAGAASQWEEQSSTPYAELDGEGHIIRTGVDVRYRVQVTRKE